MFQPFLNFNKKYLDGLIKLKKTYLVSQSYKRGQDHFLSDKTPILFTDYSELGEAQIHYSAVKADKLAAIVDLSKPEHKEKIISMLRADSDYLLFWSVVNDKEGIQKRLASKYVDNIRRFIDKNTNWTVGRNESVNVAMNIMYGDIFVELKYRNHHIRVRFDDIESI